MNSSSRLTDRQIAVLQTIQDNVSAKGYPPSIREIGKAAGLNSSSSVYHQLSQLEKLGYLRRDPNLPRAIEVIKPVTTNAASAQEPTDPSLVARAFSAMKQTTKDLVKHTVPVPMVGRIAAGIPITAEEHVDEVMELPSQLVGSGEVFMLKVVGDSMIDAGIFENDYVVVHKQHTAENGDIVAALLDGEATVKTFKKRDNHVWLLPQNTQYEPIPGDHATIMGRVVSVLRSL